VKKKEEGKGELRKGIRRSPFNLKGKRSAIRAGSIKREKKKGNSAKPEASWMRRRLLESGS